MREALALTLPFTEMKQWALDAEQIGIRTPRRDYVCPLSELPDFLIARVREAVESDDKPPFWLDLGLAQVPSRSWDEWHWHRGIDPDKIRAAIPRFIREQVLERDGYVCQLCGDPVQPDDVHLDHIKPFSKGGPDSVDNLQVTHSLCNIRKGAKF